MSKFLIAAGVGWLAAAAAFAQCKDPGFLEIALSLDIGTGYSLSGDGKGAYVDGGHTKVNAHLSANFWANYGTPPRRNARSASFNLSSPVAGSGAPSLGTIQDLFAELHVFYKLDTPGSDGLRLMHSVQEVPPDGIPVVSERTEMWVRIGGVQHLVICGNLWPRNTCFPSNGAPVSGGPGSTEGLIVRTGDVWTVYSNPGGSVCGLWNYTDPFNPGYVGPYNFGYYGTYTKKKGK